jgi:tetratricopeptide (TPR) repeat protein
MTRHAFTARVCCAALALALAFGCSSDPEATAREHVSKGDAYVANRQFSGAIIEYRNALKARPERADVHYKLAQAYLESGDPGKAYGAYARAADLDPSNVDAQLQAGTLLVAAGEFERARTRAELALKADPKNTAAYILMGNALAGLKDTKRALQEIEQAIALDPASAPAWTALGAVQFAGGGRERAGESFQKAVALAPQKVEPRLALANYQWAQGDAAAAERTLKEALALDKDAIVVHRSLALLYLATRRIADAEPHFVAVAAKEPSARLTLADYYVGSNRKEDALRVLGEVEQGQDKADVRAAKLRRASLEFAAGRKAEAHAILDALVAEKPRNVEVRIAKARLLLADKGRAPEAVEHAREAVKVDSGSPAAHYTLGQALPSHGCSSRASSSRAASPGARIRRRKRPRASGPTIRRRPC